VECDRDDTRPLAILPVVAVDIDEAAAEDEPSLDAGVFDAAVEDIGVRVDVALARRLHDRCTRTQVQQAIRAGAVLVAGRAAKPSHKLRAGERVDFRLPRDTGPLVPPEDIPLAILHEDELFVVIDKPPRLVVHPSRGHRTGTLANALVHHFVRLSDPGDPLRPGILHRLDRDTSGVIVVAKDTFAHLRLARQWEDRTVAKEYLALVEGAPDLDAGEVDLAIARHPRHRERMAVDPAGRAAMTRWRVQRRFAGFTLVECHPRTGRTHQIRVHLHALACPILCDALYGRRERVTASELAGRSPVEGEPPVLDRQALHAHAIELDHPATGKRMRFEAPLPHDFAAALGVLASGAVSG